MTEVEGANTDTGNVEGSNSSGANAKGVKLPYFHRVLTPEETALIGDITPKPIDKKDAAAASVANANVGSAWNAAQTWEEKDLTKWAKQQMPTYFTEEFTLAGSGESASYRVVMSGFSNVQGHAQITRSRGKPRFMYELSFDLDFTVSGGSLGDKQHTGTVSISDVINDQLDDIESEVKWKGASPAGSVLVKVRNAVNGSSSGLKAFVKQQMALFEADFRKQLDS